MANVIQYTIGMSNGFFILDHGIVAVDCGSELGVELFLTACQEHGIDPKQIRLLIVTHGHVDHFINMGAMRAVTGAPVLCHRNAAKSMRLALYPEVHPRSRLGRKIIDEMEPSAEPCPYLPPVEPDLIFEGEFDLSPYGIEGTIIETPGHSNSCTSVVLSDGQAIVGDLLVDDFTGKAALAYFCYATDPKQANPVLFKSCASLLAQADYFYSGHGGPFTKDEFLRALEEAKTEAMQENPDE